MNEYSVRWDTDTECHVTQSFYGACALHSWCREEQSARAVFACIALDVWEVRDI